ncbi:MAG TPA: MBOAT family O-acyltransferase [Leptospiraceae bacterium]|nr:MBOAT family O-acyltransferase [Leptospiraceae bacterium]HMY29795.1 MBOAT family O-acyltransferase [Leptospiraceae bacterium]HNF53396.1 MBOAT family O-acyltransferase [Leptospiraceae bacterium]HNM87724.1 MBOAT family O-acyltransferase [Leptospiraceae bacterium]
MIWLTTIVDFSIAKRIEFSSTRKTKFFLLFISLFFNLSILGFFKYSAFFLESFFSFSALIGYSLDRIVFNIILPAGISFYTFQSLSYTIDVYRGVISAEKSFLQYALYLAFFPQLVAGPIVLAQDFLPQIKTVFKKNFESINLKEGMYYILLGFLKKSVIADNISIITDFIFSENTNLSSISWQYLLIGILSYSIQIYGDFSGYTDIARGVALLLGFHLPENFNLPYFASSLTDFWRRWHISLSIWLRSYLYIPLGGNRLGNLFTYRNLMITMLLGGLWHGASWNFVIWGGLHGFYLAIERFFQSRPFIMSLVSDIRPSLKTALSIFYSIFTFILVSVFWIFFRSQTISKVFSILWGIVTLQSGITPSYSVFNQFYFLFFLVLIGHSIGYFASDRIKDFLARKDSYFIFSFYAFLLIVFVLYSGELKPFIYFVF